MSVQYSIIRSSTCEYLKYHAIRAPGAVALIHNGREFTYAQFHRDWSKFLKAARCFDLARGGSAAICCGDVYVHWLLLLALDSVGIVTASFLSSEGSSCEKLLSKVDVVISDDQQFSKYAAKFFHVTSEWISDVFISEEEPENNAEIEGADIEPNAPFRIVRSSGTMAGQKMMFKTREMFESRLERQLYYGSFTCETTGFWPRLRFSAHTAFAGATCCLRLGGTSIFDDTIDAAEAIAKYRPTYVEMLPLLLEKTLQELPGSFVKPHRLVVNVSGGALSERLRERTLRLLATDIVSTYSTNEVERVALVDADGVGTLSPDVQVEIVDDNDQPMPAGEVGRIRVKTPWQVAGYLDDPETTARVFRDGWFHTGDAGMLVAPRRLKVLGRHDEMLNIGGLKIAPEPLEDLLRASLPVSDLGVTSVENADGIEQICVGVVNRDGLSVTTVAEQIARLIPAHLGLVRVLLMDAMPRTGAGKLRRGALRTVFAAGPAATASDTRNLTSAAPRV